MMMIQIGSLIYFFPSPNSLLIIYFLIFNEEKNTELGERMRKNVTKIIYIYDDEFSYLDRAT
jgi:hypothetical protein